MLDQMMTS